MTLAESVDSPQASSYCPMGTPGAIAAHGAGDPGPLYAHLRREHPVYRDDDMGVWVVSRHKDVDTVLRDGTGSYTTATGYVPLWPVTPEALTVLRRVESVPVLASSDPPDHARFRRAMNATWPTTARRLEVHHASIQAVVTTVTEAFAARPVRAADLVDDYAKPLTAATVGVFLDLPAADGADIAERAAALTDLVWGRPDPDDQLAAAHALEQLWTYCVEHVEHRRRNPTSDTVTAWLRYRGTDGTSFTTAEVASILMEILITNAELAPRLVVNTLYRLLDANALRVYASHDDLLSDAVDETLRHDPPLIGWLRSTTRDISLSGTPIPAGARLLLLLSSAALDETHAVVDAAKFIPHRTHMPPNLVFGAGIRYCPGAAYSRHLTCRAAAALAAACPGLALADRAAADPGTWPLNTAVRSPGNLPVVW